MEDFDINFIKEALHEHPDFFCPETPMPNRPIEDDPEIPW